MPNDLVAALRYAAGQVGDPYVWGAEGPDGFDCSGLIYAAYRAGGFDVPRTTAAEIGAGRGGFHPRRDGSSDVNTASVGSVLYYDNPGPTDHVAIYLGGGQMIEAPQEGEPVRITGARAPTKILVPNGGYVADPETLKDLPFLPDGADQAIDAAVDAAGDAVGALGSLNPFALWQDDVLRIGLLVLGGCAAAALVIVGAKTAVSNERGSAA